MSDKPWGEINWGEVYSDEQWDLSKSHPPASSRATAERATPPSSGRWLDSVAKEREPSTRLHKNPVLHALLVLGFVVASLAVIAFFVLGGYILVGLGAMLYWIFGAIAQIRREDRTGRVDPPARYSQHYYFEQEHIRNQDGTWMKR